MNFKNREYLGPFGNMRTLRDSKFAISRGEMMSQNVSNQAFTIPIRSFHRLTDATSISLVSRRGTTCILIHCKTSVGFINDQSIKHKAAHRSKHLKGIRPSLYPSTYDPRPATNNFGSLLYPGIYQHLSSLSLTRYYAPLIRGFCLDITVTLQNVLLGFARF